VPVVLVVEDDPSVRKLLETVLEEDGYEVILAQDGLEGLAKVAMRRPDLMVLDVMMPDVGGLRVLDQMEEEGIRIPVVVITGKEEALPALRERLGAANVFGKPFDLDVLSARIAALTGLPGR